MTFIFLGNPQKTARDETNMGTRRAGGAMRSFLQVTRSLRSGQFKTCSADKMRFTRCSGAAIFFPGSFPRAGTKLANTHVRRSTRHDPPTRRSRGQRRWSGSVDGLDVFVPLIICTPKDAWLCEPNSRAPDEVQLTSDWAARKPRRAGRTCSELVKLFSGLWAIGPRVTEVRAESVPTGRRQG